MIVWNLQDQGQGMGRYKEGISIVLLLPIAIMGNACMAGVTFCK
jgi:hypothetical protein